MHTSTPRPEPTGFAAFTPYLWCNSDDCWCTIIDDGERRNQMLIHLSVHKGYVGKHRAPDNRPTQTNR